MEGFLGVGFLGFIVIAVVAAKTVVAPPPRRRDEAIDGAWYVGWWVVVLLLSLWVPLLAAMLVAVGIWLPLRLWLHRGP